MNDAYINSYKPGHRQYTSPIPGTRRPVPRPAAQGVPK